MIFLLTICIFLSCFSLGMGCHRELRAWAGHAVQGYLSRTGGSLQEAFMEYEPRMLFSLGSAGACLLWIFASWVSGSMVLGLPFGIGAFYAPQAWLSVLKRNRRRDFDLQLPDALASAANSLRAGLSLSQALESVFTGYPPPVSQEIGLVLKEMSLGRDLEGALEAMARRIGSKEAGLLAVAVGSVKNVGGNLSEVLDRLSMTLRERQRLEEKISSLTAQGKFQGVVIGLMPVTLGGALYALDPGMIERLFLDPLGWGILAAVLLLETAGIFFIRRIVSFDI